MKLAQSSKTNAAQDFSTAQVAMIPADQMTEELLRWATWHNLNPDNLCLAPLRSGRSYLAYGGDALLLAKHAGLTACQTIHADREVDMAYVPQFKLEEVTAALAAVGITVRAIPLQD